MSSDNTEQASNNRRTLELAAATSFALARLQFGPVSNYPNYNHDGGGYYYYNPNEFAGDVHTEGLLVRLARLLVLLTKLMCLVSLSAVSYAIFYQSVMPAQHVVKELHFDYIASKVRNEAAFATNSAFLERYHGPSGYRRTTYAYPTDNAWYETDIPAKHRAIPTATLDLLAKHNEWHAAFDELLPRLSSQSRRVLEPKQAYFIEVALQLPESQSNLNAGMFGVLTELYTSFKEESSKAGNGTCPKSKSTSGNGSNSLVLLATSRRSYRFRHQSAWISVIGKILLLVPLLVRAFDESQMVAAPAFRHYIESSRHPLQFVKVQILQHQDATPVEAIGGVLRIGEEFSHFQELLRTWFFTCAYVGTCWFCIFYYILYHLLCQAWASRKDPSRKLDLEEPTYDLDLDDLDDDVFEDCVLDSEQIAEPIHGDQERDSLDHQVENVAAEPVTAYEAPSATFAVASSPTRAVADPPLPNDIFAREAGSDDEWEDLPIDDSVQSDGIQASSPPPTSATNNDSQQTEPSPSRREVSDAELTELLIRRLDRNNESLLREHVTNVSVPRGEEAGNGTNERQRHPFFFFFCW